MLQKRRAFLTIALALIMAFVLASCSSDDDGTPDNARAERWWNALDAEQMVAALYGDEATADQTAAAQLDFVQNERSSRGIVPP